MHKIFSRSGRSDLLSNRIGLSQALALLCGSLCLVASLTLATLGGASSRYIVDQQQNEYGRKLAQQLAAEIAQTLAAGDLITLEVTLRQLLAKHGLLQLTVIDVENRPLGHAGQTSAAQGPSFHAPIKMQGNIAGEISLVSPPPAITVELQRLTLGLLALALLLTVFAAVLTGNWAQGFSDRLRKLSHELKIADTGHDAEDSNSEANRNELVELEEAIARLPLDLLKAPASASMSTENYSDAGLIYLHLDSLSRHVETLDETSLLKYTELHRHLAQSAVELYGGTLSVARQFGLLLSFAGAHSAGGPAFRASSCAWLIKHCIDQLNSELPMRISVSMACGLSETGVGSSQDIYPDLYNQHLIDVLEALAGKGSQEIRLEQAVGTDTQVCNRCELTSAGSDHTLTGLTDPYDNLLNRQQELVLRELRRSQALT